MAMTTVPMSPTTKGVDFVDEGHGCMCILDATGDTKIIWDPNSPVEVDAARATFNTLVRDKKYLVFKVGADHGKGEAIREFDPKAGKIIITPPLVGG